MDGERRRNDSVIKLMYEQANRHAPNGRMKEWMSKKAEVSQSEFY